VAIAFVPVECDAATPKYPSADIDNELFVADPRLVLALVELGISVAIAPVLLDVGKVEVYNVHNPLEVLVTLINKPIYVKPFVKTVDDVITVEETAPLTIYSKRISSPPVSSPIEIL